MEKHKWSEKSNIRYVYVEEISTILHKVDNTMQHIQDKDEPLNRMMYILSACSRRTFPEPFGHGKHRRYRVVDASTKAVGLRSEK